MLFAIEVNAYAHVCPTFPRRLCPSADPPPLLWHAPCRLGLDLALDNAYTGLPQVEIAVFGVLFILWLGASPLRPLLHVLANVLYVLSPRLSISSPAPPSFLLPCIPASPAPALADALSLPRLPCPLRAPAARSHVVHS